MMMMIIIIIITLTGFYDCCKQWKNSIVQMYLIGNARRRGNHPLHFKRKYEGVDAGPGAGRILDLGPLGPVGP